MVKIDRKMSGIRLLIWALIMDIHIHNVLVQQIHVHTSEVVLAAQVSMVSRKELQAFTKPSRDTKVNQRDWINRAVPFSVNTCRRVDGMNGHQKILQAWGGWEGLQQIITCVSAHCFCAVSLLWWIMMAVWTLLVLAAPAFSLTWSSRGNITWKKWNQTDNT